MPPSERSDVAYALGKLPTGIAALVIAAALAWVSDVKGNVAPPACEKHGQACFQHTP
jgi:hypothetical protein